MSVATLGEIRPFTFDFAPIGWARCDGQLLRISQNQALFALLGNRYGGDAINTFALPDLRGRAAMSAGPLHPLAESGGQENVALTLDQLPNHAHTANCSNVPATQAVPTGKFWAQDSNGNVTFSNKNGAKMADNAIGNAGDGQPHTNMQPYQVVNFCIALQGIFPTQG